MFSRNPLASFGLKPSSLFAGVALAVMLSGGAALAQASPFTIDQVDGRFERLPIEDPSALDEENKPMTEREKIEKELRDKIKQQEAEAPKQTIVILDDGTQNIERFTDQGRLNNVIQQGVVAP